MIEVKTLEEAAVRAQASKKEPFYKVLYIQVLIAIVVAILLGHFFPKIAVQMKPLGDAFVKLIKMVVGLVIFFTVVSGISGMESMKKVGRAGGKALIYFEVLSSVALLIGMIVGNLVQPGAGFNADPKKLDAAVVAQFASQAHAHSAWAFLVDIIPNTIVEAFAGGNILPVVFVSILLGYVLAKLGDQAKPIRDLLDLGSKWIFGVINVIMRAAPVGAFGAMAFTVGRYGIASLKSLLTLIATFYLSAGVFVLIVLGAVGWYCGFNVFKLLAYIKEEIVIVLGTSSSDAALPTLMKKLEGLGCSRSIVGLVTPTGYVFNTDGTNIYMTMAVLFIAQATNIHLSLIQQLAIFGVACLTSKGSAGVPGAGFVALVGTIAVIPSVPLAGVALILGIDRTISEGRALVNVIGNAVATIVVAKWEGELNHVGMRHALNGTVAND